MAKDETSAYSLVTGGSATGLSATDAWAEPQPVININVWASLCVPAGNPDVWPRPSSGLGGFEENGPGPLARPAVIASAPTCHCGKRTWCGAVPSQRETSFALNQSALPGGRKLAETDLIELSGLVVAYEMAQ